MNPQHSTLPDLPLHDILLPPQPGWWPLAPGWWALAACAAVLSLLLVLQHRRRQRRRYQRLALERLRALALQPGDARLLLAELSKLLRQLALLHYPQRPCAGLNGTPWLTFLDETLNRPGEQPFTTGAGRCLALGPYQSGPQLLAASEWEALLALCERWVRALPPLPRHCSEPGQGRTP